MQCEAREEILQRLRTTLAEQGIVPGEGAAAIRPERSYRLKGEPAGSPEVLEMFCDCLTDYTADYKIVNLQENPRGIEDALLEFLQADNIKTAVVPYGLPESWKETVKKQAEMLEDAPGNRVDKQVLNKTDAVVTASRCAIALSGVIILDDEPDQGRRICTLLPDYHFVVVEADKVFHTVPEAVALMCEHPQRTYTWSAGPSATADIELVRVKGVHGPRNLRVIIVQR